MNFYIPGQTFQREVDPDNVAYIFPYLKPQLDGIAEMRDLENYIAETSGISKSLLEQKNLGYRKGGWMPMHVLKECLQYYGQAFLTSQELQEKFFRENPFYAARS